jgi:SAM-dependent methyltransferase
MKFTAHNIDLGNGRTTMEGKLLADTQACQAIIRTLNLHFEPGIRSEIRIADLGCLEGGQAVEMARNGYQVTGFEARQINIDKCNYVRDQLGLTNLSFIRDDVKNLKNYKAFDVVFCSGLLYHLDQPVTFLQMLGDVTKKMMILDTHYAEPDDFLYDFLPFFNPLKRMVTKRLPFLSRKQNYGLSGLARQEGKQGRWFKEYNKTASSDEIEHSVWAAFSNDRAFWLCKKDLLQSIRESGFSIITEQFDGLEDIKGNYQEKYNKGSFICYK